MPNNLNTSNAISSSGSGSGPARSSYQARRPSMDRGTKHLLFAAAGLGGLLVAGMAGWALTGSHGAAIPVIEADSRPIRVKPENAGGLQVAGVEDQVMGGQGARTHAMAPAAENPAPQALRAQNSMQPHAPAPPPAAAGPVEEAAPSSLAPNLPATVAQRSAAPAQATRPVAAPAVGPVVQLAAVGSEQVGQSEWQRLAKRMPDLLNDRRLLLQRADHDGRAVWRVRTGGFADIAEATSFCARVRSKGGACSLANF